MKKKYSNFHVTVNWNSTDAARVHLIRAAVEALAEPRYLWTWLKQYDATQQVDFVGGEKLHVSHVRIRAAIEREGEHNHGVHVHFLIEVTHTTMVQISKRGLCDVVREFVGSCPTCHVRFVKGSGEDKDFILHYITKEVPRYVPKSKLNNQLRHAMSGGEVVDANY